MMHLFVYGSLQPSGPNEHVLQSVDGEWARATVRGHLRQVGWGAELGYPGLVLDESAAEVSGYVLSASDLRETLKMLDEFEGDEYERVVTTVTLENGASADAYVYVLSGADHDSG